MCPAFGQSVLPLQEVTFAHSEKGRLYESYRFKFDHEAESGRFWIGSSRMSDAGCLMFRPAFGVGGVRRRSQINGKA
jgi:hypothetical protein